MTREISIAANEMIHPQVVNGRNLWLGAGVSELIRKLHYGDPTLGWEGDPRLALYIEKDPRTAEDRWVLSRYEADGEYRDILRSRPGVTLDERLIIRLMEHDTRRGFNPVDVVEQAYDPAGGPLTAADEQAMEGLERAYHGLRKDLGEV